MMLWGSHANVAELIYVWWGFLSIFYSYINVHCMPLIFVKQTWFVYLEEWIWFSNFFNLTITSRKVSHKVKRNVNSFAWLNSMKVGECLLMNVYFRSISGNTVAFSPGIKKFKKCVCCFIDSYVRNFRK